MQPQTATITEPVQEAHHDEVVVKCPATGEIVGTVPVTPRAEIESVAARLRAAQPHGRRWDPRGVPSGWASGATGCLITPTSC